jgi:hypothetical protein
MCEKYLKRLSLRIFQAKNFLLINQVEIAIKQMMIRMLNETEIAKFKLEGPGVGFGVVLGSNVVVLGEEVELEEEVEEELEVEVEVDVVVVEIS